LISENLGDYSKQIVAHDLGAIIGDDTDEPLVVISEKKKIAAKQYAQDQLTKTSPKITTAYHQLTAVID
jgi:hypothetical protein